MTLKEKLEVLIVCLAMGCLKCRHITNVIESLFIYLRLQIFKKSAERNSIDPCTECKKYFKDALFFLFYFI